MKKIELILFTQGQVQASLFGNCEDISIAHNNISCSLASALLTLRQKRLAGRSVATKPEHFNLPGRHLKRYRFFLLSFQTTILLLQDLTPEEGD